MNVSPKYSFVIPYGNAEATILACLESVEEAVRRCGKPCEIICVNGGSTDRSTALIEKFALSEPSVRLFGDWNAARLGPGLARNVGLDCAKGEYVVFVDADDEILPTAFVRVETDAADCVTFLPPRGKWNLADSSVRAKLFSPLVGNLLAWNAMWRREAIGSCRFPPFMNFEDLVWTAGQFARLTSITCGAPCWYVHHVVEGSLVQTYSWRRFAEGLKAVVLIARACRPTLRGARTRLILARKLFMFLVLHLLPR